MLNSASVILVVLVLIALWVIVRTDTEPGEPGEHMIPYFRPYRTVGQCVRATGRSMRDCGREVLGRTYTSLNTCVDDGHAYAACSYLPLTPNA
jgi:hypothetical protein